MSLCRALSFALLVALWLRGIFAIGSTPSCDPITAKDILLALVHVVSVWFVGYGTGREDANRNKQ